eukprot:1189154-Prorocentrum_minimum.AAC.4
MHGTGTSLGDPIEVGAARGVLLTPPPAPSPDPLRTPSPEEGEDPLGTPSPEASRGGSLRLVHLQASKSTFGHAEAAAGVGVLSAALTALVDARQLAVVHLRAVNANLALPLAAAGWSAPIGGPPPAGATQRSRRPTPTAFGVARQTQPGAGGSGHCPIGPQWEYTRASCDRLVQVGRVGSGYCLVSLLERAYATVV